MIYKISISSYFITRVWLKSAAVRNEDFAFLTLFLVFERPLSSRKRLVAQQGVDW